MINEIFSIQECDGKWITFTATRHKQRSYLYNIEDEKIYRQEDWREAIWEFTIEMQDKIYDYWAHIESSEKSKKEIIEEINMYQLTELINVKFPWRLKERSDGWNENSWNIE